jgi:hypothetical protein
MEHFRPFIAPHAPPPALFIPVAEPPLPTLLVNQIDYYFRYFDIISLSSWMILLDEYSLTSDL